MDDTNQKPLESPEAAPVEERRAFEEWARAKKVDAWKVGAAKALRSWPMGQEMTEADFDQAVYDACNHTIR